MNREHTCSHFWSIGSVVALSAIVTLGQAPATLERTAPNLALDHVVVAVNDLEKAAAQFRKLGFALRPGRPHANGIRNWHAKFPDGTEIELLTAPEARDDLTRKYRQLLAQGDGGAFLALYPGKERPQTFANVPDYVFFGSLNFSPTDKPEHFAHANSANALVGVWLADTALLRAISSGATAPQTAEFIVELDDGDRLYFLPQSDALLPGRPLVGVSVRVGSLAVAEKQLSASQVPFTRGFTGRNRLIRVEPREASGIFICFIEHAR